MTQRIARVIPGTWRKVPVAPQRLHQVFVRTDSAAGDVTEDVHNQPHGERLTANPNSIGVGKPCVADAHAQPLCLRSRALPQRYLSIEQCAQRPPATAVKPAKPKAQARPAGRKEWGRNFDLKKAPKVWQAGISGVGPQEGELMGSPHAASNSSRSSMLSSPAAGRLRTCSVPRRRE
jgi:hypothetical protein